MPHPSLEILLELQELDAEARQLQSELDRHPLLCKAQEEEVERVRQKHLAALDRKKNLEKELRQFEKDADAWREALKKLSAQQFNVKTQKEYDAISQEMESIRAKISAAEEKGLEDISRGEALDGEILSLRDAVERRKAAAESEIARLNERRGDKESLLGRIRGHRAETAARLEPDILQAYETLIRQHHSGKVVVKVQDGHCGGCNMSLLAKTKQSLTRSDVLTQCDSCRRFLYS